MIDRCHGQSPDQVRPSDRWRENDQSISNSPASSWSSAY